MRRTIITILSTALVLAGTAAIVNAAGGTDREAASSGVAEPQKITSRRANAQAAVKCRSLGCLNRKLTKLFKETYKCERLIPMTRYPGYLYTPNGVDVIETTAFDETEPGDTPTYDFVIYAC